MIKTKVLVSIFGFFLFYGTGAYATNIKHCSSCEGTNASLWTCDGKSCPGYNTIGCSCSTGNTNGCATYFCNHKGGCRARDCHKALFGTHHQICSAWIPCSGSPKSCKYNKSQKLPVCKLHMYRHSM